MEGSPFNRSTMMRRSPPPTPTPGPPPAPTSPQQPRQDHAAEAKIETLDISEINNWMTSIEKCLNEVCAIAQDGKLNSEQKLRINTLSRKVGNGVSQMAVYYQDLKQKAGEVQISLQALREKRDLTDCLDNFRKTIEVSIKENCAQPTKTENSSFADMVKMNKNNYLRPSNLSSIAIYPDDKLKSSDDTKSLVQKIICPEKMKLHVRGLRKTKNGGVIISTETKDDIEKLRNSTQLSSSGLKVEEPHKRRPRIIVIGVPSALTDQEVYDCIYKQNLADKLPNMPRDSFLASLKLSHKSGKKEGPTCNFILEVPASIRKALITQDRVFINWTSCPVKDFTLVTRCFKCQQYGHAARTCRETTHTCGHCGQQGHQSNECTKSAEPSQCATCLRFKKPSDHKTGELECPARKIAESRYINSIDYNVGA